MGLFSVAAAPNVNAMRCAAMIMLVLVNALNACAGEPPAFPKTTPILNGEGVPCLKVEPEESTELVANPYMGWQTFHHFADEDVTLRDLPRSVPKNSRGAPVPSAIPYGA